MSQVPIESPRDPLREQIILALVVVIAILCRNWYQDARPAASAAVDPTMADQRASPESR